MVRRRFRSLDEPAPIAKREGPMKQLIAMMVSLTALFLAAQLAGAKGKTSQAPGNASTAPFYAHITHWSPARSLLPLP